MNESVKREIAELENLPHNNSQGWPQFELSIVMPCLNEVQTLSACIQKAKNFITEHGIQAEIIVADNGSTDGSANIAQSLGARVVHEEKRGYGAALIKGIYAARGRYILMGDSDDSYDFSNLMPFVENLRSGYDLVMGNRFRGGIQKGAMPFLHQYLGNPILTFLIRSLFASKSGDVYCGMRAFTKQAFETMQIRSTGMEFALEMVIQAELKNMNIAEIPISLYPDGRMRAPHLKTWKDGFRSFYLIMKIYLKNLCFSQEMVHAKLNKE